MLIKTSDIENIKKIFKKFILPKSISHKGDNGRMLVIGGSSLFHSASLWAAEVASHFVDIVHYFSTEENQKIFVNLKSKFKNGIIIPRRDLLDYVKEDDVILVGSGMVRDINIKNQKLKIKNKNNNQKNLNNLLKLQNEGEFTFELTKFLIKELPEKKYVFDAGSLQMMDKKWLLELKTRPILTPHQKEFADLFGIEINNFDLENKIKLVKDTAKKYKVIILLKAIKDIISDGEKTAIIEGGNQGLTKGGTGDLLAGLTAAFYVKNEAFLSALFASIILKKSADLLYKDDGYWYNVNDIIEIIPKILKQLVL
ncbi:MAG: NAD(P)H-hydrate dehydratase [Patescibacteria group bacterium]|nr:NAD(P)H-hydrate dehydratase [Patescibacteria group bacterium]